MPYDSGDRRVKVGDLIRIKEDPKNRPGQEEHFGIITEVIRADEEGDGSVVFWVWSFRPTIGDRIAFSDSIEVLSESR